MSYNFDELNWIIGYLCDDIPYECIQELEPCLEEFTAIYGLKRSGFNHLRKRYKQSEWKVLLVPDYEGDGINALFRLKHITKRIYDLYPTLMPFYFSNSGSKGVLYSHRLFKPFEGLLHRLNDLPLVVIFNQKEAFYIKVDCSANLYEILDRITKGEHPSLFKMKENQNLAYFIQLSDLHLGTSHAVKNRELLLSMLDETIGQLQSNYALKFLITGDLMDSPSQKNMYLATDFMNTLRNRYHAEVHFVLGNHDIVVKGLNLFGKQKSKIVAYILGENIRLLEDVKVVLIKLNSSLHGNFARGMIGPRQLSEMEDELASVKGLDDYTPFVLVHHHPMPVQKADFLKVQWREKSIMGKMMDKSKALIDGIELLDWMHNNKTKYIFHGHKHIPAFNTYKDIQIFGAGSSLGALKDEQTSYISYNLIQYDVALKKIVGATIFYEDEMQSLPKHVYSRRYK